eukprot:gene9432-biopygen977
MCSAPRDTLRCASPVRHLSVMGVCKRFGGADGAYVEGGRREMEACGLAVESMCGGVWLHTSSSQAEETVIRFYLWEVGGEVIFAATLPRCRRRYCCHQRCRHYDYTRRSTTISFYFAANM